MIVAERERQELDSEQVRTGRLIDHDSVLEQGTQGANRGESLDSRLTVRARRARSGPPGWAVSFPNSPAESTQSLQDDSEEDGSDGQVNTAQSPPMETRLRRALSASLGPVRALNRFMTAPLWASVLSLVVALIPTLQKFIGDLEPVVGALETAGGCSIPLTLVCLGSYFYAHDAESSAPTQRAAAAATTRLETETSIQGNDARWEPDSDASRRNSDASLGANDRTSSSKWRASSWNPWRTAQSVEDFDDQERSALLPEQRLHGEPAPINGSASARRRSLSIASRRKAASEENWTIAVAVASRMLITPLVLVPLIAWYAIATHCELKAPALSFSTG